MVQLHLNGKRKCDIIREYDISGALLDKWIKQSTTTGSFREKDNRSEMEQKLIDLRKRIFRESRNNYGTRKIKKEPDIIHHTFISFFFQQSPNFLIYLVI